MPHLFLTGAVGCGKSTIIRQVLARRPGRIGGFCTGFGADRESPERLLYLWPAGGPPLTDEAHVVARYRADRPTPLPERFDALGCPCLSGKYDLLVMDECGRLERDATAFQSAILAALGGGTPILGVVRHGLPGWTKAIAEHPNVALLTVTEENRDGLAEAILGLL